VRGGSTCLIRFHDDLSFTHAEAPERVLAKHLQNASNSRGRLRAASSREDVGEQVAEARARRSAAP
jgi:hypothetical protein